MTSRNAQAICLLAIAWTLTGCSGSYDATLAGKVTLDGQPLTTGAVTFQPVVDGPIGIGQIEADGNYTAMTGNEPGIPTGEYLITVVANGPPPEHTADNPEPLPTSLIPVRYTDASTSQLKVSVKPGSNQYDVTLTKE